MSSQVDVLLDSHERRIEGLQDDVDSLSRRVEPVLAVMGSNVEKILQTVEGLTAGIEMDRSARAALAARVEKVEEVVTTVRRQKAKLVKLAWAAITAAVLAVVKILFAGSHPPTHP